MEPLSDTDRAIAVFGFEEAIPPGSGVGIIQTSLSPETSIRNGFDVFMRATELARRDALDLIRLAEEAGARIGVARWLRRVMTFDEPSHLVTLVANPAFVLADLVDLAIWMTGGRGILRVEAEVARESLALTLRGHGGSMISIHLTPSVSDLRLFVNGAEAPRSIPLDPPEGHGFLSELRLFHSMSPESVSLEDSLEVIAVLERARALTG